MEESGWIFENIWLAWSKRKNLVVIWAMALSIWAAVLVWELCNLVSCMIHVAGYMGFEILVETSLLSDYLRKRPVRLKRIHADA